MYHALHLLQIEELIIPDLPVASLVIMVSVSGVMSDDPQSSQLFIKPSSIFKYKDIIGFTGHNYFM